MLSDKEISELYERYKRGEIDSTTVQNLLRDETPIPEKSVVATIQEFIESRRDKRAKDPHWLSVLRNWKKDYLFFIAIMGNKPDDMSFTAFVKHCTEHGAESKRDYEGSTDEWRKSFWDFVAEIDMEISIFGDEF